MSCFSGGGNSMLLPILLMSGCGGGCGGGISRGIGSGGMEELMMMMLLMSCLGGGNECGQPKCCESDCCC